VGEIMQEEKECDRQREGRPIRRGEYWERHGVAISMIANRIKVFKISC
jgi:hypothetical protein